MAREQSCSAHQRHFGYSPYGYSARATQDISLIGFNGEPNDCTGFYLLGQGYRAYSPLLMRFLSPDALSPFNAGGINAYAYCKADPINFTDPTGEMPQRPVATHRRVTLPVASLPENYSFLYPRKVTRPVASLPENYSFLYPRKKPNPHFVQQPRSILKKTSTLPIEMPLEPLRDEFELDLSGFDKDELKTLRETISNELSKNKLELKALRADHPRIQKFIALRNFGRRVKTMLNAEAKAIRNEEQDNTG